MHISALGGALRHGDDFQLCIFTRSFRLNDVPGRVHDLQLLFLSKCTQYRRRGPTHAPVNIDSANKDRWHALRDEICGLWEITGKV